MGAPSAPPYASAAPASTAAGANATFDVRRNGASSAAASGAASKPPLHFPANARLAAAPPPPANAATGPSTPTHSRGRRARSSRERCGGRCRYVPLLGVSGVLLCLAGLAIYAGGAVPAGRTISELVKKVDVGGDSGGGSEESASSSRPSPGPLSRLVGAYVATTAASVAAATITLALGAAAHAARARQRASLDEHCAATVSNSNSNGNGNNINNINSGSRSSSSTGGGATPPPPNSTNNNNNNNNNAGVFNLNVGNKNNKPRRRAFACVRRLSAAAAFAAWLLCAWIVLLIGAHVSASLAMESVVRGSDSAIATLNYFAGTANETFAAARQVGGGILDGVARVVGSGGENGGDGRGPSSASLPPGPQPLPAPPRPRRQQRLPPRPSSSSPSSTSSSPSSSDPTAASGTGAAPSSSTPFIDSARQAASDLGAALGPTAERMEGAARSAIAAAAAAAAATPESDRGPGAPSPSAKSKEGNESKKENALAKMAASALRGIVGSAGSNSAPATAAAAGGGNRRMLLQKANGREQQQQPATTTTTMTTTEGEKQEHQQQQQQQQQQEEDPASRFLDALAQLQPTREDMLSAAAGASRAVDSVRRVAGGSSAPASPGGVCPSVLCLDVRLFPALASDACVCSADDLDRVGSLAATARRQLRGSLVGLACLYLGASILAARLTAESARARHDGDLLFSDKHEGLVAAALASAAAARARREARRDERAAVAAAAAAAAVAAQHNSNNQNNNMNNGSSTSSGVMRWPGTVM